ncbi:MAG: HNH endonuclease [Solirubrobacteraceae bacterium]
MSATERECLFCKKSGRWTSVEHLFPHGLGRHTDVKLPPGAVCGRCNNTLGREVDEALIHLLAVRLTRGCSAYLTQRETWSTRYH